MSNALHFLPVSDSNQHNHRNNYPLLDNFAGIHHHQPLAVETNPLLDVGSVYPIYYGFEAKEPSHVRASNQWNACSNTIFVGIPVISPTLVPSRVDLLQSLSCGRVHRVPNRIVKETAVGAVEELRDGECDLSLRLGICMQSNKTSSAYEVQDVGLRVSQEGRKFGHSYQQKNEGYCCCSRGTGYGAI